MPTVSSFYGIIVYMGFRESDQHHLPHVHVRYSGKNAVLAIEDGSVLDGDLDARKLKMTQVWMDLHREELLADWELAREGKAVYQIQPLR